MMTAKMAQDALLAAETANASGALGDPGDPECSDVATLLVRHILSKAILEFGKEEIIQSIISHMLVPIGKRLLPFVVFLSIIVLCILIATIATMMMVLSCFFRPSSACWRASARI